MKPAKLDDYDVADLAAAILGMEEWDDYDKVDWEFLNAFDITLGRFQEIVEHLLPMIDVGTGISGKRYKGYATDGLFHVKQEIV